MGKLEDAEKDDSDLRGRLGKLQAGLEARRASDEARLSSRPQAEFADAGRGMSLGFRAVAELLGGILVGAAIGWQLDRWLSTTPWLMIVFLFLGAAAGVLNTVRAAAASSKRSSDGDAS